MSRASTVAPGPLARQDLREFGAGHVFHMRYAGAEPVRQAMVLTRASGLVMETSDGTRIIDAIATHHNVNLGHCHPELCRAAFEQMTTLGHVATTPGVTNEPLIELTHAILRHGLPNMGSVFYALSGAEAVEATFKIARYYWHALDRPAKHRFITLNLGYHGNTLATLAACGRDHNGVPWTSGETLFPMFEPLPDGFLHVRGPFDFHDGTRSPEEEALAAAGDLEALLVREDAETLAALVYEPIQGHNFYVPHPTYYRRLRELCDEHEILLISDEMITGFCRTGRWWGMEHYPDALPDITSFGKGITSGHVPLSGAIPSDAVWRVIQEHSRSVPVEITNTYSGHPTLCATALRNVQILEDGDFATVAAMRGDQLRSELAEALAGRDVFEVRGAGLMAAVELDIDRGRWQELRRRIPHEALSRGLLVRAELGNRGPLISMSPPFIATEADVTEIVGLLDLSLAAAGV